MLSTVLHLGYNIIIRNSRGPGELFSWPATVRYFHFILVINSLVIIIVLTKSIPANSHALGVSLMPAG